ncbi:MAG TPA: hypothetical protein VK926_04140, partial [Gaiellaceae bacterium]|nr:hypothetical protein [Gaiellaceae bacterium]
LLFGTPDGIEVADQGHDRPTILLPHGFLAAEHGIADPLHPQRRGNRSAPGLDPIGDLLLVARFARDPAELEGQLRQLAADVSSDRVAEV